MLVFRIEFLIGPAFLLSLIWSGSDKFSIMEILWAFSIYLEAFAILPQLFMIQVKIVETSFKVCDWWFSFFFKWVLLVGLQKN